MPFIKNNTHDLINLNHARRIERKKDIEEHLLITFEYGNATIELTEFEEEMPLTEILKKRKVEI